MKLRGGTCRWWRMNTRDAFDRLRALAADRFARAARAAALTRGCYRLRFCASPGFRFGLRSQHQNRISRQPHDFVRNRPERELVPPGHSMCGDARRTARRTGGGQKILVIDRIVGNCDFRPGASFRRDLSRLGLEPRDLRCCFIVV